MSDLMQRAQVSLQLGRCACGVIWQRKKLLLFPLAIIICVPLVVLLFLAPLALIPTGQALTEWEHWHAILGGVKAAWSNDASYLLKGSMFAYIFCIYLTGMIVVNFADTAFFHEIRQALAGDPVSLRRGLAVAAGKLRAILCWSLLAATVGLLIPLLAARLGWVGRGVTRTIGIGWNVAAMFAIPALLQTESSNPLQVLRNSSATLKKSWGESVGGYLGLLAGLFLILATFCVAFFAALMVTKLTLGKEGGRDLALAVVGGGWLVAMGMLCLWGVANSVYVCALYVYASEGVVPGPFTAAQMDAAWKVRQATGPLI